MTKIVVIRVSPMGDWITIGLFPANGGDARMTFTLSAKLFPEGIKVGDSVDFKKVTTILQMAGGQ